MHRHNNYNKEEPLMPTKQPSKKRDENGKFVSEKAVVSRVGEYEETPVPEKTGDVTTRHGSTIHYS